MPLATELVYNHLDGENVREILITRFTELVNAMGELQRHVVFPQVKMKLELVLEVKGRTPERLEVKDKFLLRMADQEKGEGDPVNLEQVLEGHFLVNSDPADVENGGQHPDEVREEHGLPIPTPKRGPMGTEDVLEVRGTPKYTREPKRVEVPAPDDASGLNQGGPRNYATWLEQDFGPARARTGQEAPLVKAEAGQGHPDVKREDWAKPDKLVKYQPGDVNHP